MVSIPVELDKLFTFVRFEDEISFLWEGETSRQSRKGRELTGARAAEHMALLGREGSHRTATRVPYMAPRTRLEAKLAEIAAPFGLPAVP